MSGSEEEKPAAAGELLTRPGVREDSPICGRLPDNPGESASMIYTMLTAGP